MDLQQLSTLIQQATIKAVEAAAAVTDGGTANLDCVVLSGLAGVREASLKKAGIAAYKHYRFAGSFMLSSGFGIGDKNYVGVQAMYKHLKENGVDCYVHYQID